MSEINQNSNENQTNSQRNSRIIEWINRDSEKTKVDDLSNEELTKIDESNKSNYKNYFIIGSVIILSCLSWYYWDTLKYEGESLLEWIKSFSSGGSDDDSVQ